MRATWAFQIPENFFKHLSYCAVHKWEDDTTFEKKDTYVTGHRNVSTTPWMLHFKRFVETSSVSYSAPATKVRSRRKPDIFRAERDWHFYIARELKWDSINPMCLVIWKRCWKLVTSKWKHRHANVYITLDRSTLQNWKSDTFVSCSLLFHSNSFCFSMCLHRPLDFYDWISACEYTNTWNRQSTILGKCCYHRHEAPSPTGPLKNH